MKCRCKPNKIVCLYHRNNLCPCPYSKEKCLVIWHHINEYNELIALAQEAIDKLQ